MKIAVGITGASGAIYAKLFMQELAQRAQQDPQLRIDTVWSKNAFTVWEEELGDQSFKNLQFQHWDTQDYYAPFASGSAGYDALVIVPCSMGTLARIAAGVSDSLITRAADVMLKERKKLICVVRETPYNLIHINNMKTVTEAGGIICPASPSFYSRPKDMEELSMTVVNRIFGLLQLPQNGFRWGE